MLRSYAYQQKVCSGGLFCKIYSLIRAKFKLNHRFIFCLYSAFLVLFVLHFGVGWSCKVSLPLAGGWGWRPNRRLLGSQRWPVQLEPQAVVATQAKR